MLQKAVKYEHFKSEISVISVSSETNRIFTAFSSLQTQADTTKMVWMTEIFLEPLCNQKKQLQDCGEYLE